ncbi:XkdF-like putative serine protease domain-containing protein [Mesorhizobium sp. B1-1-8]|uniref:XkdF-like putative serine protease domain-containing protein n=1 Tax=Mesorhizobium sp. B1-1-8 TaxID=2589976 RepID=UPI0015E3323F|nr:XkdF-like putative serine protease domain-containing protein [Mesorhizobium sp. B1-1-8]UCI09980.1 XkdF-like putative serine protease domain-containing protein [Mesorhizobium sp. B1-1-8]
MSDSLGLIFGWALVSEINGEPYYDLQGDYVPQDAMLRETTRFMENNRMGKLMHAGEQVGTIVHSLPLTADIAKALGISTRRTGWIVAYKPTDSSLVDKVHAGIYGGFSIGGTRGVKETETQTTTRTTGKRKPNGYFAGLGTRRSG